MEFPSAEDIPLGTTWSEMYGRMVRVVVDGQPVYGLVVDIAHHADDVPSSSFEVHFPIEIDEYEPGEGFAWRSVAVPAPDLEFVGLGPARDYRRATGLWRLDESK